ncbi:TRAP transporter permease [Piscinibacter sakaiensis]|uniref:TRAP transporter permease n=1 Tax=Piscinibacter sakaiensis TaxID=1547922 RepID=UPI003AAE5B87
MAHNTMQPSAELGQLVAETDTGGRSPRGIAAVVVGTLALGWALFQLWYASPLPFALGWGVVNDTQARALHLGLALALAFLVYPSSRSAPRDRIPLLDVVLAVAGGIAGAYLLLFYAQLATRPGQTTTADIVASVAGVLLLLEATRRAVGAPMAVLAVLFLAYIFAGPLLPDVVAHKGASLSRVASHMWLSTEGVYGVALGVSVSFIFVFVLFGTLLDRAGAGNYMMQVSMALLGHLRGGPAKVAVVSSGLNGLISGSSVSNVVSGGIFTIPLMKKAGYGGVKAGAIETMSSVNGQIMPPVMGAAAFLMVEYVGIPYSEIIWHAFLPATISYIALFYIVHLEALKLGMMPMAAARPKTPLQRLHGWSLGISGTLAVCGGVYFVALGVQAALGAAAPYALALLLGLLYLVSAWLAARAPELPEGIDVDRPELPPVWPTVQAGLHFLIPIGVLIWCLMIESLSPGTSAFWALVVLIVLMLTQHPLRALLRGLPAADSWRAGGEDVLRGLLDGSRNMVGIAIATGCAGIVVGTITLSGLGLRLMDFVELVSGGSVVLMLLFTAFVCLVLGMGVPTTANYILVATLMAPIIVELGARSDLVIPLIAVHLFVFYYGIMGDITPPVGLATFAAAAISREDPIATGIQGSLYALRTAVLPFVFVFNPTLLLIDVRSASEVAMVAAASILASLAFAAATMGWFRIRCRWWEVAALLLATFLLFRPDFVMDRVRPAYQQLAPSELNALVNRLEDNDRLVLVIRGETIEGDELGKTVAVRLGPKLGDDAAAVARRLGEAGLTLSRLGDKVEIAGVRMGSRAARSRVDQGFEVIALKEPAGGASANWIYLAGVLILALLWVGQGRRRSPPALRVPAAA